MAVTSPSVCALSPLINGSAYTIRVLLATSHQTTTAKTNISTSVTGHPHSDIPNHISTYSITYEVPQSLTLLYCVLELTLTPSLRDCEIKEDIKFCRRQCMVRTAGSFSPVQCISGLRSKPGTHTPRCGSEHSTPTWQDTVLPTHEDSTTAQRNEALVGVIAQHLPVIAQYGLHIVQHRPGIAKYSSVIVTSSRGCWWQCSGATVPW